jgi:predicted nucleic acid-binding protein
LQAVEPLREGLHGGEYEAIALALETSNLLLIDEAIGRRVAMKLGVRITGVLGILLTAKNQRLVEQIRPLINRLRTEIDFHLSDQIVRKTLVAAGE